MVLIVLLAVATGIIIVVSVAAVVREAKRLATSPAPAVYDPDEALDWVVRHIADAIAATLTLDDLRRLLDLQVQYLRIKASSGNGSSAGSKSAVVFGGSETVDYILERAAAIGAVYTSEQVYAVVETHLTYLDAIGALGPAAESPPGDERPSG